MLPAEPFFLWVDFDVLLCMRCMLLLRCPHKRLRFGDCCLCFILNPTVTPSSDKSSCLHCSCFLQTFFCNLQNQHSSRPIGLRDSQWWKATKLDRFQDVFAFSLSTEQCRSILDRSQTTSWSDAGWIDPKSISKKCKRLHSARIKARSISDRSSP